jgi:hypothetical protein
VVDITDPQSVREQWYRVVAGECGGAWVDGCSLVAWTMRKQVVEWGYDERLIGPRTGWYGYSEKWTPTVERIVDEAMVGDPWQAPFDFMRAGKFCVHLGNHTDKLWWEETGYYTREPDKQIWWGPYQLNCYFTGYERHSPWTPTPEVIEGG